MGNDSLGGDKALIKRIKYNIDSAKLNKDYLYLYEAHCQLGDYYFNRSSWIKAIKEFLAAVKAIECKINTSNNTNQRNMNRLYAKLFIPYKMLGICFQYSYERHDWFSKAISFHTKHLYLAEKLSDTMEKLGALINLGLTYFNGFEAASSENLKTDKLKSASVYFNRALETVQNLLSTGDNKNSFPICKMHSDILINLGLVEMSNKKEVKALDHFKLALEISLKVKYEKGEMLARFNIGMYCYNAKQYYLATIELERDREINEENKFYSSVAKTLIILGRCYFKLKNYKQCKIKLVRLNEIIELNLEHSEYSDIWDESKEMLKRVERIESMDSVILEINNKLKFEMTKIKEKDKEEKIGKIKEVLQYYIDNL